LLRRTRSRNRLSPEVEAGHFATVRSMMKRCVYPVSLVCLVVLAWCPPAIAGEVPQSKHSDALLVYPGATQVSFKDVGPLPELSYSVAAKYPAPEVIRWISSRLEDRKWRPLKHDLLNPDLPSSEVAGWSHFVDPKYPGRKYTYSWAGHWMDAAGNAVSYILQYHSPREGEPESADLQVLAVYSTADVVKIRRKWFEEIRKKYDKVK